MFEFHQFFDENKAKKITADLARELDGMTAWDQIVWNGKCRIALKNDDDTITVSAFQRLDTKEFFYVYCYVDNVSKMWESELAWSPAELAQVHFSHNPPRISHED